MSLTITTNDSSGNRKDITESVKRRFYIYLYLSLSLYSVLLLLFSIFALGSNQENLIRKQPLKESIHSVINNGGDLEIVKHIYNTRQKETRSIFVFKRDNGEYYSSDYPLSSILNDLLSDYLSSNPFVADTLYYNQLLSLIEENNFHFPFDNLEEIQRYYFDNVRLKTDEYYETIQPDITRIADELHNKNLLVEKYLSKSNTSFIISVIALVLTLGFSLFQIIQNRITYKMQLSLLKVSENKIEVGTLKEKKVPETR
jgi:hypothetical protein